MEETSFSRGMAGTRTTRGRSRLVRVQCWPVGILRKVDGASMAHVLEVRSPFMDHLLAEHAMSLPVAWNADRDSGKRMLKQLLSEWLPPEIVNRPKEGFGAPVIAWLHDV